MAASLPSEYELARAARMDQNAAYLASLGLGPRVDSTKTMEGKAVEESVEAQQHRRYVKKSQQRRFRREAEAIESTRASLYLAYPGREREIDLLLGLVPSSLDILVSGPTACGKTAVSRAVLEALNEPFAWLSCATLTGSASIFERAAIELERTARGAETGSMSCKHRATKLDVAGFVGFVESLGRETMTESMSLVLDDAEAIFRSNDGIFPSEAEIAASVAGEVTWAAKMLPVDVRLRVIVIGEDRALCTASLATNSLSLDPVRVDFQPYSADALANVLVAVAKRRKVPRASEAAFTTFARQIVAVGRRTAGAEPRHLLKLCASAPLFELYYKPDAPATANYDRIKPILKLALEKLHDPYLDVDMLCNSSGPRTTRPAPLSELAPVAALALLAAFVASYSPKDSDSALFTNASNNKRRRRARSAVAAIDTQADHASKRPLPVPLDRLLSVHAYFLAAHTGAKAPVRDPNILSHLARLSNMNLLERSSSHTFDDLNRLKFNCLLVADQAYQIAHALRFPLTDYLPRDAHMI